MYLGEASIIRMQAYLQGYEHAEHDLEVELPTTPSWHHFHDWVAGYYGWSESTAGWCNIIMQHSGNDEKVALDQFYKLTDQFRKSRLHTVCSIKTGQAHQPTGQITIGDIPEGTTTKFHSSNNVSLIPSLGRVRNVPPQITIATYSKTSRYWYLRYHYDDELEENPTKSESDAKYKAQLEFGIADDEWISHDKPD